MDANRNQILKDFTRILQAGVSIVPALLSLERMPLPGGWSGVLTEVRERIERGETGSEAISAYPDRFGPLVPLAMKGGETSGRLVETLERLVDLLDREAKAASLRDRATEDGSRVDPGSGAQSTRPALALWCRRVGLLLWTGAPVAEALSTASAPPVTGSLREGALLAAEGISTGESISAELARYPEAFPEPIPTLVASGESAREGCGTLDQVFYCLADIFDGLPALPSTPPPGSEPHEPDTAVNVEAGAEAVITIDAKTSAERESGEAPERALNALLDEASRRGASEVYLDSFDEGFLVRCRVEGAAQSLARLSREEGQRLLSRLKLLASLPINSPFAPRKGGFAARIADADHRVTVSLFPYLDGESARLQFRPAGSPPRLEDLGMLPEQRDETLRCLHQPYGVLAVVGEDSEAVTVTLYALLAELSQEGVLKGAMAASVEAPIIDDLPDVMQVPTGSGENLTAIEAIRALSQHDIDLLMVSPTSDPDLVQEVIRTSVTGRMTLVGLPGGRAVDGIEGVLRMEPNLGATQIVGAIAARWIRTVCSNCSSRGCETCGGWGYQGHQLIFELLSVETPDDRMLLTRRRSAVSLADAAKSRGMLTLERAAARLVETGVTTRDELERVLASAGR